jgi:hypothetical protein
MFEEQADTIEVRYQGYSSGAARSPNATFINTDNHQYVKSRSIITVDTDIPDKTMPAVNNAIIAAYRANPVNPIILSKMDIQPAGT